MFSINVLFVIDCVPLLPLGEYSQEMDNKILWENISGFLSTNFSIIFLEYVALPGPESDSRSCEGASPDRGPPSSSECCRPSRSRDPSAALRNTTCYNPSTSPSGKASEDENSD